MQICFRSAAEDDPGPTWATAFARVWPGLREWFLQQGDAARPTYLECRRAVRTHLPELVPLWHALIDVAGGGDRVARALSLWRPSPYLTGCSQAIWTRGETFLARNYDYHPDRFDGTALRTGWLGTAALGMLDCGWGVLDGVNEHGLCVALSFAGRRVVGTGFGIPLLLRHALQTCGDVPTAVASLSRLPTHMSYHVTLLDARGRCGRLSLCPDRPAVWTEERVATNHSHPIDWPEHAKATHSVERRRVLERALADPAEDADRFVGRFLRPPLFQLEYRRGFGTLYTARYRPAERTLELIWPDARWVLGIGEMVPGEWLVRYPERPVG